MSAHIDVKEMLYALQGNMLESASLVIQASLNAPRGYALYPWERLFCAAQQAVDRVLRDSLVHVVARVPMTTAIGPYCLWAVRAEGLAVKRMLVELEECSPCGRLWDLDVVTRDGPIDRRHLGLPARKCLLCADEAHVCRKLSRHEILDVVKAAQVLSARCTHD